MSKSLSMVGRAARAALQWRLLLLWVVVVSIPTALVALPLWRAISAQLDHSVQAADWARTASVPMLFDLVVQLEPAARAFAGAGIAAMLVLVAGIPFLNALFAGASRSERHLRLGELLHAGLSEYGPMLRLLLVALIPLGLALGLSAGLMKAVHKYQERAILESQVDAARWAVRVVALIAFGYAHAGLNAGRAWLAFHPRRRSALIAWWHGARLVWFHPLRSLGPYLAITLLAAVVLAVLALLRAELPPGSAAGTAGGLLVTELIAVVIGWMHYARLFALVQLTEARAAER